MAHSYSNVNRARHGGKLTYAERAKMPQKEFALPSKREGGKGGYPIPDINHARNALARAAQNASSSEQSSIRSKVYAKYPGLKKRAEARA